MRSLTDAAETLYKNFCENENGFFSGTAQDEEGRTIRTYNRFPGTHQEIEKKLQRKLTPEENTILSLAIGRGPTPCLSDANRKESMEYNWPKHSIPSQKYVKLMRIICSF